MRIDCLPPHGFVRLVSYMQPIPDPTEKAGIGLRQVGWTGDLEIVRNARVSYNADWRNGLRPEHQAQCFSLMPPMSNGKLRPCNCQVKVVDDRKFIRRLWHDEHTSPFEAMVFTFEVSAPIFVVRQWHRHRTWSYNEISGRYAELPEEFWSPASDEIGYQDPKNKQARIEANPFHSAAHVPDPNNPFTRGVLDYEEHDRQERMAEGFRIEADHAFQLYRARLGEGCPREVARVNLPLSTFTRMFATVNLSNLFHFIRLRSDSHAQKEIRVYSDALLELIRPIVPFAVKAFEEIKWVVQEPLESPKKELNIIEHQPDTTTVSPKTTTSTD